MTKPATDWEAIEREYRAGQLSIAELARQHNLSRQAIIKRAKRDGWVRDLAAEVRKVVSAKLVTDGVTSDNARGTVELAAARAVEVVRSHRRALSQLNAIGDILANRLAQHLDGVVADGPGLGDKESPADMLEKLSRTRQRAIQLERQAFSLDSAPQDDDGGLDRAGVRDEARREVRELFDRRPEGSGQRADGGGVPG